MAQWAQTVLNIHDELEKMKKLACLILCLFFWNCCPICNSHRFYTIEKSADVDAVEKYRDVHYLLNTQRFDFVDDTLQEHYYECFLSSWI